MPIFREIALAVPALIVSLVISAALFGSDQPAPATTPAAISTSWIGAAVPSEDRWLAKESFVTGSRAVAAPSFAVHLPGRNLSPHARITGVFAQFVPGEGGHAI